MIASFGTWRSARNRARPCAWNPWGLKVKTKMSRSSRVHASYSKQDESREQIGGCITSTKRATPADSAGNAIFSTKYSWLPIELRFEAPKGFNHDLKRWNIAEDHTAHGLVVPPQNFQHSSGRRQCKAARNGMFQVEIRAVEKHSGMACAIDGESGIRYCGLAQRRPEQLMHVVVVP